MELTRGREGEGGREGGRGREGEGGGGRGREGEGEGGREGKKTEKRGHKIISKILYEKILQDKPKNS